ncbi:hypothetical protein IWZ03DRAFT_411615 [Phyllosticta citriasiana]|uniref:F-box domain-containing protein n=2 Tax=Phyllosticta citriasiana TaxID=595635 RepID=A0ABR1L1B2_9PEZI
MSERSNDQGLFRKLPGELQNQIFLNLDYPSAILLSRTNRYFRQVVRPSSPPTDAEKLALIQLVEMIYGHFFQDFACTSCFRLKCREEFGVAQIKNRTKGSIWNPQSRERFCLDCGINRGFYATAWRIKVFDGFDDPRYESWVRSEDGARYLYLPSVFRTGQWLGVGEAA